MTQVKNPKSGTKTFISFGPFVIPSEVLQINKRYNLHMLQLAFVASRHIFNATIQELNLQINE